MCGEITDCYIGNFHCKRVLVARICWAKSGFFWLVCVLFFFGNTLHKGTFKDVRFLEF